MVARLHALFLDREGQPARVWIQKGRLRGKADGPGFVRDLQSGR